MRISKSLNLAKFLPWSNLPLFFRSQSLNCQQLPSSLRGWDCIRKFGHQDGLKNGQKSEANYGDQLEKISCNNSANNKIGRKWPGLASQAFGPGYYKVLPPAAHPPKAQSAGFTLEQSSFPMMWLPAEGWVLMGCRSGKTRRSVASLARSILV